jgi:hypothetical protein
MTPLPPAPPVKESRTLSVPAFVVPTAVPDATPPAPPLLPLP